MNGVRCCYDLKILFRTAVFIFLWSSIVFVVQIKPSFSLAPGTHYRRTERKNANVLQVPNLFRSQFNHLWRRNYNFFKYSSSCRLISDGSGSPAPFFPSEEDSTSKSETSSTSEEDQDKSKQQQPAEEIFSNKSFRDALDDFGSKLKPRAAQANAKAASVTPEKRGLRYFYLAQSCVLYTAFIIYRGYRGFFVILPAVFRETFRKLQDAVDEAPFDDDDTNNNVDGLTSTTSENNSSKALLWQTRVTITVLSAIVTCSYVLGGILRVLLQMFRTLRSSKWNVTRSFAAAADEQEKNEKKLFQRVVGIDDKKIKPV